MRQKEAKTLIIMEWDRWLETQSIGRAGPSGRDTLKFFFELQDMQSPLLDFQLRGRDKWQIIHTWLMSEERVSARHARGSRLTSRRRQPQARRSSTCTTSPK
jgi:hypothetical protein